jgi:poly(hydroxyalkanoate) granule-associated protein
MVPRSLNPVSIKRQSRRKDTIMARKPTTKRTAARKAAKPARARKPSASAGTPARKAWLAGVGAAVNAREIAGDAVGKVIKQATILVKQGKALQAQGTRAAMHRAEEARSAAIARAGEARTRASAAVSHLEKAFEQRVSKVLEKVGVPTSQSVRNLTRRVAELQANVDQLRRSRARA